jgi:hypothetical protein
MPFSSASGSLCVPFSATSQQITAGGPMMSIGDLISTHAGRAAGGCECWPWRFCAWER